MADVLIVCVREDEPQAKALAEMFEAAGFSIGGAPSSDAALRSSGAGVVVWSQASIRSRPFLDAAQRVINANKAVVASLIEPPPPSSIGDSPAFDLSHWSGDPNDPSLDPLFFAVDRMVNTARASVGAPARQDDYEAPPAHRPAPRAQPPAPAPMRPSATPDLLGSEAEHWRAIRDSRDPADFMDYLSRYGPQGSFAEVAELRLKQLTAGAGGAQPRTPALAPTSRAAPPRAQRTEPPRRDPPRRTEAPPPPSRRPDISRRLPPERYYDRADLREPSRGEGGGALRAFVLIALLGGAALAGGLYFGGGMGDLSGGAPREPAAAASTTPLDAPSEVPLGDSAELETPTPMPIERHAAAEPRDEPPPTRERERTTTAPAATTTVAANNLPPSGGPISLTPGGANNVVIPNPTSSVVAPLQPPPSDIPVSAQTDAAALRGTTGSVTWTQRPTARRISDLYPQRALREGTGGRVQLDCTVLSSLSVACSIASESPAGEGFGRAALSAASAYRANPTLSDGASAVGARTRIAVAFQAPQ
jgi:protein TonB